jgi:hypothetical protein
VERRRDHQDARPALAPRELADERHDVDAEALDPSPRRGRERRVEGRLVGDHEPRRRALHDERDRVEEAGERGPAQIPAGLHVVIEDEDGVGGRERIASHEISDHPAGERRPGHGQPERQQDDEPERDEEAEARLPEQRAEQRARHDGGRLPAGKAGEETELAGEDGGERAGGGDRDVRPHVVPSRAFAFAIPSRPAELRRRIPTAILEQPPAVAAPEV